jgi:hypothetical protein
LQSWQSLAPLEARVDAPCSCADTSKLHGSL